MKRIDGDAKTIRGLLGNAKYKIDYYQREYRWETKQVTEAAAGMKDLAESRPRALQRNGPVASVL